MQRRAGHNSYRIRSSVVSDMVSNFYWAFHTTVSVTFKFALFWLKSKIYASPTTDVPTPFIDGIVAKTWQNPGNSKTTYEFTPGAETSGEIYRK